MLLFPIGLETQAQAGYRDGSRMARKEAHLLR